MIESWRWYGEFDPISLHEVVQTGASSIVTALHGVPYGEVWSNEAIASRKSQINKSGFSWDVVESLPVHESIKLGEGDLTKLFANYRQSMANLANQGVRTICYNFMPLLDWTRTDLAAPTKEGSTCLRFDIVHMAAFEVHMLKRQAAEHDYSAEILSKAAVWFQNASETETGSLLEAVLAGMPGAFDRLDLSRLSTTLEAYEGLGRAELRRNYKRFLDEVVPAADDLSIRLCVHPDDPPRDILGLPRIVSTGDDLDWILAANESSANGITLCSGSLGANPNNDIPAIASRVAHRIHFAHLRNVSKEEDGSFQEAQHLAGDTDMAALVYVFLNEQMRRQDEGRGDQLIPFRPDHGHHLKSDNSREFIPGYPLIGRLRGLAELRGLILGLSHV